MVVGLGFTALYMYLALYQGMEPWFGISPEGIGAVGAAINFIVAIAVSLATRAPSEQVQALVEEVRHPRIETIPATAAAPARGR
jgi:cation/acetate symporter